MKRKTCPHCGAPLHIYHWRPECPHCGVNMIYYHMKERLEADADRAEAEFARLQPKIDRAKASYVGSKAAIVRLVCNFLPLPMLLLPLVRAQFLGAFADQSSVFGGIALVKTIIAHIKSGTLLTIHGFALSQTAGAALAVSVVCLTLSALTVIVRALLIAGSCGKGGKQRMHGADLTAILLTLASIVAFLLFADTAPQALPGVAETFSLQWGASVYAAAQIAFAVLDTVIVRRPLPVKYTQCYVGALPAEEYFALQRTAASQTR